MITRRAQFLPTGRALAIRADSLGMLFDMMPEAREPFELEGDCAVVDVRGPLVQHKDWCWMSYDDICEAVRAAAASPAAKIILKIDSPGGDALGMMECARELRAIAKAAKKPLIGFVDGMACSAAYCLLSPCAPIVAAPAALVGSVGIFQPMVDATGADRAMGLVFEMISSGERKLDGNPHVKISDGARAETQRRVDGLADLFFGLVAEMRPGVSASSMRALEGGIYLGAEAVTLGLADSVGSWSDVLALVPGEKQASAPAAASTEEQTMKIRAAAGEETSPENDKKSKARKAFFGAMEQAFDAMFGDDDPKPAKKDGEAAAEEETPEKKEAAAKAKAEEEKKKEEASAAKAEEEKKVEEAKALAAKSTDATSKAAIDLALKANEENAKLRAELAAKDEAHARAALMAERPDFTAGQRDVLALVSLDVVKKAVKEWPRGPMVGKLTPPGILAAAGTHGGNSNHRGSPEATEVPEEERDYVRRGMGIRAEGGAGVTRTNGGRSLELGPMTSEQARASLAEDEARAKAQKAEHV